MSQPRRPWPIRRGTASARADGPLATSWRQLWISPATTNTRTAASAAHRIALSTPSGPTLAERADVRQLAVKVGSGDEEVTVVCSPLLEAMQNASGLGA